MSEGALKGDAVKDFVAWKIGESPLDCRPGRTSAISRWLSEATPPDVILKTLIDPSGIADLFNEIDERHCKSWMRLESLQDSRIVDVTGSGGVASLSHRLITVTPLA